MSVGDDSPAKKKRATAVENGADDAVPAPVVDAEDAHDVALPEFADFEEPQHLLSKGGLLFLPRCTYGCARPFEKSVKKRILSLVRAYSFSMRLSSTTAFIQLLLNNLSDRARMDPWQETARRYVVGVGLSVRVWRSDKQTKSWWV